MANLESLIINDSGSLKMPVGNDGNRPSGPSNGMMRFNTSRNLLEFYDAEKGEYKEFSPKPDGLTPASGFDSLDDLQNTFTEDKILYHTYHGNYESNPEQIDISFANPSQPKYKTTSNAGSDGYGSGVNGECYGLNGTVNICDQGTGPAFNMFAAMRACIRAGNRLCTEQELLDGATRGTGCGHDNNAIWTSTKAADGRYVLRHGNSLTNSGTENRYPTETTDNLTQFADNRIAIRCCTPKSGSDTWDIR